MRRIRNGVAVLLIASGLGAAGAGAAQAATLTVDHPCYYSFGRAHEPIHAIGAGFAPMKNVNLFLGSKPYHVLTGQTGAFDGRLPDPAPSIGGTRARVTLSATDGQNAGSTRFYLTDVRADFSPSSGAPSRLKVRFTVTGLGAVLAFLNRDPQGGVFAHYIRPNGRLEGTRQFGHLSGPCGDLRTSKTRLLPYGSELGLWKVYFDTNRSYKKREIAQLVVGFNVTRILIRR